MIEYEIKKPVWKTESVGIAAKRLVSGTSMVINIAYRDKNDELVYPYRYKMPCRTILKYPTQSVKGTVLHIVPIKDFEVIA